MVSIPACHAGNPGSIPGLGAFCFLLSLLKDKKVIRSRFVRVILAQGPC